MSGYKKLGNEPIDNSCPTPEQMIQEFLKSKNPRVPKMMPSDPFRAAQFWIAHQLPRDNFTEPDTPPINKGGSWKTPYHDRLIYTLNRFLRLKTVEQLFIIDGIERGIHWKGEGIDLYQTVVEEFDKLKEDREKYIKDGFKAMAKACRRMTV